MYRKRNNKLPYIIGAIIISVIVLLSILSNLIDDSRKLTLPEKLIKDTGLFINKIIYKPIEFINDKIKESKEKQDIYNKYKELQNKIESVNELEANNQELKDQVNKMKETLELNNTLSDYEYLNATVISRNMGYWFNNIIIDKGEKNGIKVDMPVVVKNGLIGRVVSTTNFNSTVKLLTTDDLNNKISVKLMVDNNYIYGVLTHYDKNSNSFIIEGIDQNVNIPKETLVVTSGFGNSFPSGIVIGKVKNIETDNFDLAKTIEVQSLVNFNDLSYVTILFREVHQ